MSADLTRRGLVAASALGVLGAAAQAAETLPGGEPRVLAGSVSGGQVSLPPLHAASEAQDRVPEPDPAPRRLGVAVVGLGHLALTQIMPAFGSARHVRPVALVSGDPAKAQAVAAQYGVKPTALYDYKSFDRLRDNDEVDIVYIVLPNAMHREYTERAAAASKHVLCEKPMATSSADAQAMIDAVKRAGKRLMIAYRMQYEPYNRALIQLVRSGGLGSVRLIEAINGQNDIANGQWRQIRAMAGGGSLPDVGLYCLNAARYLTGEEPVEVSATVTRPQGDPRFREIEDICAFTLRFPSGVVATCASGYSLHSSRRLRVMGTDAWAELDPAFDYAGLAMHIGRQVGRGVSRETRNFDSTSQFALEMDAFAVAIRNGVAPRTPGEEGLADMRLIETIYRAAEQGAPVRLPQGTGLDVTRGALPPET